MLGLVRENVRGSPGFGPGFGLGPEPEPEPEPEAELVLPGFDLVLPVFELGPVFGLVQPGPGSDLGPEPVAEPGPEPGPMEVQKMAPEMDRMWVVAEEAD